MTLVWEQVTVDARDPQTLGWWWADALGWVVVDDSPDVVEIRPDAETLPGLLFVRVDETKTGKNRLHVDLRPDDQAAEVARFRGLGAQQIDIGQGDVGWVVLADPEGNEFCILSAPMS
ncbi:MAG: VOC family protein [Candidatus Nanopelagicales bacterium]|jgi:predicted enzyme related to lactoylglutathione lyase